MRAPASSSEHGRAPILVLGLGNVLLADDGVGSELLDRLREIVGEDPRVELLDGGTQGIALLPHVQGRRMLLILDALALGAAPGTIHVLTDIRQLPGRGGKMAHESNAAQLLAALELIGGRPESVAVVGIEPAEIETRLGLSERVDESVPAATGRAVRVLDAMRDTLEREVVTCTS